MKYLMLLLFYFPPDSTKQKVNLRVFNSFSKELFTDSLWIQDGTILSICDRKSSMWILPNDSGVYEFEIACKGFSIGTNKEYYSEFEIGGLEIYGKEKIVIDSSFLFPYYGQDTTFIAKYTERLFRKDKVDKSVKITPFGTIGFSDKEAPREIEYVINGEKKKLRLVEFKSKSISGTGKDEKGRKFGFYSDSYRFFGFYSNEF
ncbi:MAG: hypothetical protein AAF985_26110 [Bacteroidota bacterium]